MADDMPTFGSLFAGIGGIDLGLERAGWTGRWQVEYEPFCQRVLAKHWPDVIRYGDIRDVDWSGVERVDLVAGGFPCQPVSSAGHRKAQADERWLWPEFARCLRFLRPRYVLVENVTNLLAVNEGSAFGEVVGDLAALGYDAEWDCVPASAVGALHERDRVWIVAYADGHGRDAEGAGQGRAEGSSFSPVVTSREHRRPARGRPVCDPSDALADAEGHGLSRRAVHERPGGPESTTPHPHRHGAQVADPTRFGQREPADQAVAFPTRWGAWQVASSGGRWAPEPDVGRVVDGVSGGLARRRESALRGLGNAVVPQVVEVIGRRLMEIAA